jgi:hypothetical protein
MNDIPPEDRWEGDGSELEMEVLYGAENSTDMFDLQCVVLIVAHHAEDQGKLLLDPKEVHCAQRIANLKFVFVPLSSHRFVYVPIDNALFLKVV